MNPGFMVGSAGPLLFGYFDCPGPTERCDPKHNPLGKGQGRKEVGDDMRFSRAEDGLRGVWRDGPLFGRIKRMSNAKWE